MFFKSHRTLDSIAVSVFVVILVGFDKYYQKQTQISTDGETSRHVYILDMKGLAGASNSAIDVFINFLKYL